MQGAADVGAFAERNTEGAEEIRGETSCSCGGIVRPTQAAFSLKDRDTPAFGGFLHELACLHATKKKIVTTNGCFDLLHLGHIRFLEQAASLGEVLIVGLNSDASVRRLKGPGRPIVDETARAATLSALRAVDFVVVFDESTPCSFLELVKPALHCKAADYVANALPEADVVEQNGGRIEILPVAAGYSTSETIRKAACSTKEMGGSGGDAPVSGDQTTAVFGHLIAGANTLRQTAYGFSDEVVLAAQWISSALKNGHKLMLCGNGGSATTAQYIAAEFVGRCRVERAALPALALTADPSVLTALGTEYDFDRIYARQVAAWAQEGDVLVALFTSGCTANVVATLEEAHGRGVRCIALTGKKGGTLESLADLCIAIPAEVPGHIQQAHLAVLDALCSMVERTLRSK